MMLKLVKFTKGLTGYALLGEDEGSYVPLDDAWSLWLNGQPLVLRPLPAGARWKRRRRAELPKYCHHVGAMVEELWRQDDPANDIQFANPEEAEEVEREKELRDRLWYAGFVLDRPNVLDDTADFICGDECVGDEFFLCWDFIKAGHHGAYAVVAYAARIMDEITGIREW